MAALCISVPSHITLHSSSFQLLHLSRFISVEGLLRDTLLLILLSLLIAQGPHLSSPVGVQLALILRTHFFRHVNPPPYSFCTLLFSSSLPHVIFQEEIYCVFHYISGFKPILKLKSPLEVETQMIKQILK